MEAHRRVKSTSPVLAVHILLFELFTIRIRAGWLTHVCEGE